MVLQQIGELLQVLRLEVVAPDDEELSLSEFGVLLLDRDVAGERVLVSVHLGLAGAGTWHRQLLDELVHAHDRLGGDLRWMGVVDAAGDVTVSGGLLSREEAVQHGENAR